MPCLAFDLLTESLMNLGERVFNAFVFQGLLPGREHAMFIHRIDQQVELAWTLLAQGRWREAQNYFDVYTSRIITDFIHLIFHHLR